MTQWKIKHAKKVYFKNKGKQGDLSQLEVAWQHPKHGVHTFMYVIQSAKAAFFHGLSKRESRGRRYPIVRRGTFAAVKDVVIIDKYKRQAARYLGIPELVLKSPHEANHLKAMQAAVAYYRKVGIPAYDMVRERRSSHKQVATLLMQKETAGSVITFHRLTIEETGHVPALTLLQIKKIVAKTLARLQVVYAEQAMRGISAGYYDLKPDNLAVRLNDKAEVVDMVLLDVDGAFEDGVTSTYSYLIEKDCRFLADSQWKTTRPDSMVGIQIDRRMLANLAIMLAKHFMRPTDSPIKQLTRKCALIDGKAIECFREPTYKEGDIGEAFALFVRSIVDGSMAKEFPKLGDVYQAELVSYQACEFIPNQKSQAMVKEPAAASRGAATAAGGSGVFSGKRSGVEAEAELETIESDAMQSMPGAGAGIAM